MLLLSSIGAPLAFALSALVIAADPPAAPTAYLGLSVRDIDGIGCVVSWIDPGPLDGNGITSPHLNRPDLLVTINGSPASTATLARTLATTAPGATVTLGYRAALQRGPGLPQAGGDAASLFVPELQSLAIVVADPELWRGTIGSSPLPSVAPARPEASILSATGDGAVATAIAATDSRAALDSVCAGLAHVVTTMPDARRSARMTAVLERPLALPDIARDVAAPARWATSRPVHAAALFAAENLDAAPPPEEGQGSVPMPNAQAGIYAMDFFLNGAREPLREALGDAFADPHVAAQATAALRGMRESLYLSGAGAPDGLAIIRRGAAIDMSKLVAAIAHLDAELNVGPEVAGSEVEEDREELKGFAEGDLIASQEVPELGWLVVGGAGPNRYDLSRVAGVIDIGGDDSYRMSGPALGMRGVIDLAGNDRYEGHESQGIAAGVCGLFFVDDKSGDDIYIGRALHAGVGVFGAGLLIDRSGNDVYSGTDWSLGAAAWGAGVLMDLAGNDTFTSEFLSQGCAGPRGAAALIDARGNDVYDAVGGVPSLYGTPGVRASFSQGIGVGVRRHASGGVGVLCDHEGSDRYEAGEFSQGGGYFFGLGVLADHGGNDCYLGNRYAQGFAAHQAAGALLDDAGNDTYVGMTAASQGAAWDQSVAILLDAAGSDSYQADSLSQGSAAQQSLAFLVDLDGSDRFVAGGDIAQGSSGTNEYHFDEAPPIGGIHSFSLLLDLGSGCDFWSTGRGANRSMRVGQPNPAAPARGTLHGLFIDAGPGSP